MKLAETEATIYTLEENVLVSTLKPNHKLELMDILENVEARKKMGVTFPVPVLIDFTLLSDISLKANIVGANPPDNKIASAVALVISKTLHQLIAREAKRFKRNLIPMKVFQTKNEGLIWLNKFVTPS